jgi:hypothetical protein
MTRKERNELLNLAVNRLEEAAKLLAQAEEELLSDQAKELAELVDVVAPSSTQEAA